MRAPVGKTLITMSAALVAFADHAYPQSSIGETLSGPDSHETGQGPHGHLLGDWGGVRFTRRGDFLSMIEEAMSIMPIVFVLIILLFGFDPTGQDPLETQLRLTIAREMSEF